MTAYAELLTRLSGARRFGVKLGLDRMRALLDQLGAPDRELGQVIHVGGTNGKGSTVAFAAALAASTGAKVATYTSPHLSTLRERIQIGGALASEDAIVDAARAVDAAGGGELTFFEQITAIGMRLIAAANVDVTVLEVGLGGRLDATNVVDADVAVVTGVALDHQAILGATLEAIAREKAGIFKPGRAAVVGCSGERAAEPLLVELARAARVADVVAIDDAAIAAVPVLGLVGAHQRANAAAAIAAVRLLGRPHTPDLGALAAVRHAGRFEQVGDLVLDGAHNEHGARALAATLVERGLHPLLVLAVSEDKDIVGIVRALRPEVRGIIASQYAQDRSLSAEALAAVCRAETALTVEVVPDLVAAVTRARAVALGGPILVAGSLLAIGEVRARLLGAPADPIAVTDPPARPALT